MPAEDLPSPGFGTLRMTERDECVEAVTAAIDVGYRHIDTGQKYDNEAHVGDAIEAVDVPRDDLFVASKVHEAELGYDDVLRTTEESLDRLGVETIDLHYIHWPAVSSSDDRYDPEETIPAFNELLADGSIRHFGVGNHDVELMETVRELLDAPLFANQVEMHPLLHQDELVEYARATDTYLVAYCPLVRGAVGDVPELVDIAAKHDATPGQVSLAWLASKDNVVPIPRSKGAHIEENYRARDLELDPADLDRIDAIDRERRVVDREKGPWHW